MSRDPHRNATYWVHSDPDVAQIAHDAASDNPPCDGPCNQAYRAARVDADGDHIDEHGQVLAPVPGQPVWCRPCADRITAQLRRLPDLAAAVVARRDGRLLTGTADTDRTRTSTRAGSPTASPALDVVDDLAAWAADLVDELSEHLRVPFITRTGTRRRIRHLTENVAWLHTRATALLCHDDLAAEAGRAIPGWVTRLERAAGQDRLRHRLPAPCPTCDLRALVRDDGSEQVDCTACGRAWVEADYRRLVMVLADEARRAS